MARTKEQLVLQNQKLADDNASLRAQLYNVKGEKDKLEEEAEDYKWRMQKAINQIHFLAGILYEKGVKIDERCGRLDIIVEENGERED